MISIQKITKREKEILKLIFQAKSRRTIALELKISINTLDKHLHHLHIKTNTHSSSELIIWLLNKNKIDANEFLYLEA